MPLRAEFAGAVDLFALHRQFPQDYPFLLQSVAGHPLAGRYDLLFAYPSSALELPAASTRPDFFTELSAQFDAERIPGPPSDLPFIGGWFLLLGYEAARQVEPRLKLPDSPYGLPDALAVRCPAAVVVDRQLNKTHLVAEQDPAQLERLTRDIKALPVQASPPARGPLIETLEEDEVGDFLAGVEAILEYLKAGDAFQVNLSRAWRARLKPGIDYIDVYEGLRRSNPAPFAGLARWNDCAVLSSSPERLVQSDGIQVQTRPIAGTQARGSDQTEDEGGVRRMLANLKERAEHVMLIDLERNDMGRICESGSVVVSELMTAESYAHVHHIVSNITGQLRDKVGPGEILRAVFPGGTITGCPKVRAMEIIAELEGVGRGPYTGAMGYLSRDGQLDMNILIRTLVCEDGVVSLRAGAGIVADSKPLAELAETRAKARGLLLALTT
jgi:anthranilate synthase component 1